MAKNLYVGNLSSEVTQEDLKENFKEVGEVVSAVVIKDKFTGESKGFGFVEMPNITEAEFSIKKLVQIEFFLKSQTAAHNCRFSF